MLSYPDGTFVPIAIATHGLVGLTLGAVLFERPRAGLVGGLFPDADFLFPDGLGQAFVHRSFTHSFLLLGLVAGLAAATGFSRGESPGRRTAGAVAVAYLSHLLIDTTTPQGVQFLWPVVTEKIHLDPGIGGHAAVVTAVLWVVCPAALAVRTSDAVSLPSPNWG